MLKKQGFVILDGGLATELERHGADLNDPLWSGKVLRESPELVEQVNYDYFMAGADVGVSASYQISGEEHGLLRESVAVVRRAAARVGRADLLVGASVGPYGAFLLDGSEFRGDYALSNREFKEFHRQRLGVLASCEPDIVAFETIPKLSEAEALAELMTEFPGLTAWMSFSCRDEAHISDGTPFREAVAAMDKAAQVVVVGMNCVAPRFVNNLLEQASGATGKPLVAYPNSGECFLPSTRSWGLTSELGRIAEAARGWYERGARLIGGCCRTTPETIRAIRDAVSHVALC